MPRQSSLPLEPRDSGGSLIIGPSNRAAIEFVLGSDWRGVCYLEGPACSGKSAIAEAWVSQAGGELIAASGLSLSLGAMLMGSATVAVDGLENLRSEGEEALFHLFNARTRSGRLLLTSRAAPGALDLRLPDLRTRLRALTPVQIEPPDDDLLLALILSLAERRQLALPEGLARFLLSRMGRTHQSAVNLVEALDRLSLARGGPLTRELAADALESSQS